MTTEIFISYKSERRPAAEHLAEILRKHGYSVWFDYSLIKGEDFDLQLDQKLREAKAVVVLWCSMSAESQWVNREATLAAHLKRLVPVMIEDCELKLAHFTADFVDLRDWDGAPRSHRLDPLFSELARLIGRPPQTDWPALARYDETWRRFGAPSLVAFAGSKPKRGGFLATLAYLVFGLLCVAALAYWIANRSMESRQPVSIASFSIDPQNDQDLVWLKTKIERNFVEYFVEKGVAVAHPPSTFAYYEVTPSQVVGAVERNAGGNVEVRAQLLYRKKVIAAASHEAPLESWQQYHKSIPELMIFALGVIPETLTRRETGKRPTTSLSAALLYFEAARLARAPQLERASAMLDRAIAEDGTFAMAFWAKSQVLKALGNIAEGEEWAKKAATLDPDHPKPSFTREAINPLPNLFKELQVTAWTTLKNHISFKEVTVSAYGIQMKAWAFSPTEYRLEVVTSDSGIGSTAQEFRRTKGAILAVNGGFFDIDGNSRLTPSGLLIEQGKVVSAASDRRKGGSGVVYERARAIGIDFIEKFTIDANVTAAVQVGPLVVDPGGKNGIRRNDYERQDRSAICQDQRGRIVVIVVTGGLSLYELGEVLSARESDGGFACDRALNLDGGPSTQASFALDGKDVEVAGRWKIANALLVFSR